MTGLRKGELASLSPKTFFIWTVNAQPSRWKRSFKAPQTGCYWPLHKELVAELREWFVGLATGDKLFPTLRQKHGRS